MKLPRHRYQRATQMIRSEDYMRMAYIELLHHGATPRITLFKNGQACGTCRVPESVTKDLAIRWVQAVAS